MNDQVKSCENTARGTMTVISLPLLPTQPQSQPTCEKLVSEPRELGGLSSGRTQGWLRVYEIGELGGPPGCRLLPCNVSTASPALSPDSRPAEVQCSP